MSYARFGSDSDVYVFRTVFEGQNLIECCGCQLKNQVGPDVQTLHDDAAAMLRHFGLHYAEGHKVPIDCWGELAAEAAGLTVKPTLRCAVEAGDPDMLKPRPLRKHGSKKR